MSALSGILCWVSELGPTQENHFENLVSCAKQGPKSLQCPTLRHVPHVSEWFDSRRNPIDIHTENANIRGSRDNLNSLLVN